MQFAEGTVTAVNQNLMFYEINKIVRVYTTFTYTEEYPFHLIPSLGATITINPVLVKKNHLQLKRHLKFVKRIIILKRADIVQCSLFNLIPIQNSRLINFIKRTPLCNAKRSICIHDIETINKMYDLLQSHSGGGFLTNVESFLFQIMQVIQNKYASDVKKCIFHTFTLHFLDEVHFIHQSNYYIEKNWNYSTCSIGSFGDEFLFAYLYVDRNTGMPFLTDGKCSISCTGCGENSSRNLSDYINKFLLIKEYTLVYEFYKENEDSNVEVINHVLFKLKSVICVRQGPDKCPELRKLYSDFYGDVNSSYAMSIQIEGISLPIFNGKDLEVWLEIKHDSLTKYLRLESNFYKIFPLLKAQCIYKVYPKRPLFKTYHVEIYKLNTRAIRQGLPIQSVFELTEENSNYQYQNVESAENCLKNAKQGEMISFTGKLTKKSFIKPLVSKIPGKKANFGTPGSQIHVLEFKTKTGPKFSVFLYDWEARPIPHCLIPNMVLIVHNVLGQNGTYFKSCYMTSFEVVAYEPPVGFQGANFFFANGFNSRFGTNSILSCFRLPYNVLISSTVNIKQFVTVDIQPANNNLISLRAEFKILVIDKTGYALIEVDEDYGSTLLHKLTQLPQHISDQFCKSFIKSGKFTYPKYNKQNKFHVILATHLRVLEEARALIDIKCILTSEEGPVTYKLLAAQMRTN